MGEQKNRDEQNLRRAEKWRDDAVADGWSIKGTYAPAEPVERAARLTRDGWVAQIITREVPRHPGTKPFISSVHVWGPDGLAVEPGREYDWDQLTQSLTKCLACGAEDVPTQRVGFAGRCCEACLPAQRKQHEYPGWTK